MRSIGFFLPIYIFAHHTRPSPRRSWCPVSVVISSVTCVRQRLSLLWTTLLHCLQRCENIAQSRKDNFKGMHWVSVSWSRSAETQQDPGRSSSPLSPPQTLKFKMPGGLMYLLKLKAPLKVITGPGRRRRHPQSGHEVW